MIPAKPFYLIRHGETDANVAQITAGGGLDSPLTENGRLQAAEVAAVIHTLDIKPTRIVHSPMTRARDTAQALNRALGLLMHEIDDLREHLVGDWEGQPWADIMPHLLGDIKPPNGENRTEFAQRVKRVLNEVLDTHDDPVLIVAHGGTFHSLTHMHKGFSPGEFRIRNCHLHYFEPHPEHKAFPWKVWEFDIREKCLVKKPAPFCSTQVTMYETALTG